MCQGQEYLRKISGIEGKYSRGLVSRLYNSIAFYSDMFSVIYSICCNGDHMINGAFETVSSKCFLFATKISPKN